MHTGSRILLALFALLCLPGLLSCGRRARKAATPTSAPVSRMAPPGGSETAAKLSFHTTEAVGHKEYVVILVDFPDVERGIDAETLSERMLWFIGEYFNQASYGKLAFDGTMPPTRSTPRSPSGFSHKSLRENTYAADESRTTKLRPF